MAAWVFAVGTVGAIANQSIAIFLVGLVTASVWAGAAIYLKRDLERHGPDNWRYSWTALWRKLFQSRRSESDR